MRQVLLGREANIDPDYAAIAQVTWDTVLRFIHRRFHENKPRKGDHQQWDGVGHYLFTQALAWPDEVAYVAEVLGRIGGREPLSRGDAMTSTDSQLPEPAPGDSSRQA